MTTGWIKIKEWFEEKIQNDARRYHMSIDVAYKNGYIDVVDDCVFVCVQEKLSETEKAVKVVLSTGYIDGSYKGWTTWIPKSVICE